VQVTTSTSLREFRATLATYADLVRKTPQEVIEAKARDVSWALYRAFGQPVQADARRINAAAAARSWVMRRRGNSLAPSAGAVSVAAEKRARALLGENGSALFRVSTTIVGTPAVRFARFSKSGKLLKGRRAGRSLAELSAAARERAEAAGGFKRLNLRALSLALEASLRAKAALGGTMRVQWMPRTWRKRSGNVMRGNVLEERNKAGKLLGMVSIGTERVTLTGAVPEVERIGNKTGAFSRAFADVRADMLAYIRRKLDQAAAQAYARANRPPQLPQ
jgi:hypothetical protein